MASVVQIVTYARHHSFVCGISIGVRAPRLCCLISLLPLYKACNEYNFRLPVPSLLLADQSSSFTAIQYLGHITDGAQLTKWRMATGAAATECPQMTLSVAQRG